MKIKNKSFTIDLNSKDQKITFEGNMMVDKMAGKTVGEMKDLLYSHNINEQEPLYDFYVGVAQKEHHELIVNSGLRYDLIMVSPGHLDGEYKKTSGHKHTGNYPEIYEVLSGTALFLLQKGEGKQIKEFAAVKTKAGEKILIPPGYTHATVNIGDEPLLFSDLVADSCQNLYDEVKDHHGMCYYVVHKEGNMTFVKNQNYENVPVAKVIQPVLKSSLGIDFKIPIYDILIDNPQTFDYLVDPDKYMESINYLADIIEGRR